MKILVHVPFNVGWLFHDLVVRASLDFRPGTVRTMTCPGSPMAVVDGHSTPGEEALTGSPMHDFTIDGDYGTVRGSLTLEPEFDVKPMFYYQDDVLTPDPPETSPGHYGDTGVAVTGWEALGRGDYRMSLSLSFAPTGAPTPATARR